MKYYYARVSTQTQNLDRQLADIEECAVEEKNVYVDKMSGKNFDRENYQKLLKKLQPDDVIFIHSIDRLGRNYDEIMKQWKYITQDIGADIVVLDMPLLDTRKRNQDLTNRFIADIVLQLLSYVAEREREMILTRQREGIRIAKDQGKYKKKDINMEKFAELKAKVDEGLIPVTTASAELGVSRKTWYILAKKGI